MRAIAVLVLVVIAGCTGAASPPSTAAPQTTDAVTTAATTTTSSTSSTTSNSSTTTTSTTTPTTAAPRPIPAPVAVRQEPEGVTLADPTFEALPGATAEFGRLGGAAYQVEVPDEWNGRLVLWMHGFEDFGPEAGLSAPDVRAALIAAGSAWAASSFSSTSWIPGRAADETAALWDHFVATHGRPQRTYVIGLSMGGAAGHLAAERYGDRFDGVLALCGAAGATPGLMEGANQFVAAAFAAGVTQAELDATVDVDALIRLRLRPALEDPARRDRYERILIALTGGPRPFAREGLRLTEEVNWRRIALSVLAGVVPPRDAPYELAPWTGVPSDEFNAGAVRLRTNDQALQQFVAGNEVTGVLQVPLLTMHSTGDGQVPIEQARILQRRVDAAGAHDLLVQRIIRDAGHCGFTTTEWLAGLDALVRWVELGVRPEGNDVLLGDLAAPEPQFELQPRPGTPDADVVTGAEDRVVLRGTATLDGGPFDAPFLGASVVRDGLVAACQLDLSAVEDGAFEVTVVADDEAVGCGVPGAQLLLWTLAGDAQVHAIDAVAWPGDGSAATVDVTFSSATPAGAAPITASFVGEALGADGQYVAPGTPVEAFVGATRCGAASTRRTGSFSGFTLFVSGPDAVAACTPGATLTFRVDGRPAAQTAVLEPGVNRALDLTVP